MSRVACSVAMTEAVHQAAQKHLIREDGQEDICFALWRPSTGATRRTALIDRLILPGPGDRRLHGNVSFEPQFFERAMAQAAASGAGMAMMHSHPLGLGWQGMSDPDVIAEQSNAGSVWGATDRPFLGLTTAGDGAWSARFWDRIAPRKYEGRWCGCVRVVGEKLTPTFMNQLAPVPKVIESQLRTISAWGDICHADLTRLRIGVIGAGSVGGFVAEALARTGFEDVTLIDFDLIKPHNLDRLLYAFQQDVGKPKAEVLAARLADSATANGFKAKVNIGAVYEEDAYRDALDCDVIFSCVDRPWGRHVLNQIAYAHLIPVIDGGILVRTNRSKHLASADWTAQTIGVGRPCLQCLGQYDAGFVQLEREGKLDDPKYIEGLPDDHPLKVRQNVFAFSMACASLQVLQLLNLVIAPLGISNSGRQRYHFVDSKMESNSFTDCHRNCLQPSQVGLGDDSKFEVSKAKAPSA